MVHAAHAQEIAPQWSPPLIAPADAQSRPGRAAGQSGHLPYCDETVIRMAPQWPQLTWQVLQQDWHQCFSVSLDSRSDN